MADLAAEVAEAAEVDELRRVALRLQRQLASAKQKSELLVRAIYDAARDAAVAVGRPAKVPAPPRDTRSKRAEYALLHTTDWQVGKRTETYSTEIAGLRLARLAEKVVSLTTIQRAARPIRECHVLLGGDMIEGLQIFPGQAHEVDATLYTQLFAAARFLEAMIRTLAASFEVVHVWEALGNHGRLGRRGDYPHSDNADAILYGIVSERFRDQKRIRWTSAKHWYQIVPIGSYRALLVHGDQVRGFGGNLPSYGIVRKANAWSAGVLEPFTDTYMGHFHQHLELGMAGGGAVYVTGSPESGNEYAREFCAATGAPSQRLHFVDGARGRVTSSHKIYLDDTGA